jgi:GH18 family chitinase
MRLRLLFVLVIISYLTTPLQAANRKDDFRIVGYYSIRSAMNDFKNVPFNKLTHINLYFHNPDTLGNFVNDFSALEPFIGAAHKKNVKVLFSIAGGGAHPYYHALLKDDKRAVFIENLVSQVLMYNFDGIDVDIEGGDIDENYEPFVIELATALRRHNKLITSAIAIYYKDQFTDRALAQYDFMNVMVYDRTGPWRPEIHGQHASYEAAVEDLDYFINERKIPADKIVLGVPFYGYGFGPDAASPVKTMSYRQIVDSFPGSELFDEWKLDDGMIMYYNGIPTMKKKTELAKEKSSGVMIWQISGDADGSKSLLKTISKTSRKKQ